ncbi:hypothetical protein MJL22_27860, partial [Salmonella enterica subsp. enterica serovar Montevideo]|nr:hypothetical protein [Salmonella enterica subsp. enterica serovar Montevideo]
YLILRRHYLPHGQDSVDDIAAAIWLDNRHWEYTGIAVANGVATKTYSPSPVVVPLLPVV